MFAMGALCTTAQTMNEITGVMGTEDRTVIPVARGKNTARNVDLDLRAWLRAQVTRTQLRKTKCAPPGLAVDLAPTTVRDIDGEGLFFTSGRIF